MKYDKYVEKFYRNQNIGAEEAQKGLYSKDDYENLLKSVRFVLEKKKDASLDELRTALYEMSGVEELLKDFILKRKMAPGAVISYGTPFFQEKLIVGNKQEVVLGNEGFIPSPKPMTEDTIFDLASCTKLFTAISTLKLVEQKQINLNDDITKYAPHFSNLKGVTIFDLLKFEPLQTEKRIDKADSIEEAENILFTASRKELPYGKNAYNDFSPMVLKYAIEAASGMKYKDYVQQEILNVLDMKNTFVKVPSHLIDITANSNYDGRYYKDGNYLIRTAANPGISTDDKARILGQPNDILSGHAGLFSTADDMEKLSRALISNKILDKKTRDEMAKNRTGFPFIDENGKLSYRQYLGMLCYSKSPNLPDTEVRHPLSGRSFASAGWTGTQHTTDPINKINLVLLSDRTHNRMTFIDPSKTNEVTTDENGVKRAILPNGLEMIDATKFAWDRDVLVQKCIELAIQYRMLEEIMDLKKEKSLAKETTTKIIK